MMMASMKVSVEYILLHLNFYISVLAWYRVFLLFYRRADGRTERAGPF